MSKFVVTFVVFLKTSTMAAVESTNTVIFHQNNDKILDILDDLFIALKINKNFSKSKNMEEYLSKRTLIQDALSNNHKKYNEILDISKTNISHKVAYYISKINKVVEEMIRKETVREYNKVENDSNKATDSEDFVGLARRFNLNIKTLATPATKLPQALVPSQDEVRRIFAGTSSGIERYPFMVSVHVAGRFVCAGSLLHENLVISAASCLIRTANVNAHVQIRVASNFVSKMGFLVNVEELIFHPEFDKTTLANNLVILRTRKALRFKKKRVVAIEYDLATASALKDNKGGVVILGWGRRKADETDVRVEERPLSEARVELYDFSACQYIYTKEFVTNKTFCAGFIDRGAGACNHDAGGPALVGSTLVGVISFGSPHCGAAAAPTVFTRLSRYEKWIDTVFQRFTQYAETSPEPQNITGNILRGKIVNLEEAIKEVYRENFNVDDVLYGPIETDTDNSSQKIFLHPVYPSDPKMFPNPAFIASLKLPKPETPELDEIPDGYWKDSSTEQKDQTSYNYTPKDQTEATVAITKQGYRENQYQVYGDNAYEDNDETTTEYTSTTGATRSGNYFDIKYNNIKANTKISCEHKYKLCKNKEQASKSLRPSLRENPDGYNTDEIRQPELKQLTEVENSGKLVEIKVPSKAEIDKLNENEKAIILMLDSGTTQKIYLHKNDPVYERGFKLLATKVLQAQELVKKQYRK